jgi:hypothetical protein
MKKRNYLVNRVIFRILALLLPLLLSIPATISFAADSGKEQTPKQGDAAKKEDGKAEPVPGSGVEVFGANIEDIMPQALFSKDELLAMDPSIFRISLYRTVDKENQQLSKKEYDIIENELIRKFKDAGRFRVTECLDCKTTQLLLKKDTFTIVKSIESNDRLGELCEKLGVDGFVFWNVYKEEKKLSFNLRLVSKKGEVVWANRYSTVINEKKEAVKQAKRRKLKEYDGTFYIGLWSYPFTRTNNGTLSCAGKACPNLSSDRMFNIGVKAMRTDISPSYSFGMGLESFSNLSNPTNFSFAGFAVSSQLNLNLDYIRSNGDKKWQEDPKTGEVYYDPSIYAWYFSGGIAMFDQYLVEILKTGFEANYSNNFFFKLGFIYLPTTTVTMPAVTGYGGTSDFGGLAYEFGLGIKF